MGNLFSGILSGFTLVGDVSLGRALVTIILAFIMGLFILFIYKRTFTGVVYTKSFGYALVMLGLITSMLIMVISSNLMLSLGTVGALSIVRFRTAVKDAIDTVFMFWSIGMGIMMGSGLYLISIISCLLVGLAMVILSAMQIKKDQPYVLVLRFHEYCKADVQNLLRKLKSKTVARGVIEMTLEMNVKDQDIAMIDRFARIDGVLDATLISYTGDLVA